MYIELIRWSSNISFFIPVSSSYTKKVSYQHIMSDIKLPIVVEKRSIDVHLDDECTLFSLLVLLWLILIVVGWCYCGRCLKLFFVGFILWIVLHDQVQLINLVNYWYSSALIWVLSRFDYPYIPSFLISTIALLLLLFLFFDELVSLSIILTKLDIFRILYPILYMKSKRDIIKRILFNQSIVFL